ncbi:MAG: hypothetical protein ACYC0F_15925 [Rhodanobacter sp.]
MHRLSFGWSLAAAAGLLAAVVAGPPASAGNLRDALMQRRAATGAAAAPSLPPGARVIRDVPYGSDPRQRFDVYVPPHAARAPVIFMVHGGG